MAFHSNGRARPRPAWLPRGDDVHRPAGGSGDGGGGGLGQLSPGEPSGRPVGRQDRPDARGRVARLQTPKTWSPKDVTPWPVSRVLFFVGAFWL